MLSVKVQKKREGRGNCERVNPNEREQMEYRVDVRSTKLHLQKSLKLLWLLLFVVQIRHW